MTEAGFIPAADAASIPTGDVPKTVADVLAAAADLIARPGAWTQDAFSKAADGVYDPDESEAIGEPVCWCALGAIAEVAGVSPTWGWKDGILADAKRALEVIVGPAGVPSFNDAPERTQAEVVAALRAAAEKARTANSVGTPEGVNQ